MRGKDSRKQNREATVSCRLRPEQAAKLTELAERDYMSVSGFMRRLVLKELERDHERAS